MTVRTIAEAHRAYQKGRRRGGKFLSYRKVAQQKEFYEGDPYHSFVVYFHHHTISINYRDEIIKADADREWAGRYDVMWAKYGADSALLTVTVKNYSEAEKFENNRGAFQGLYILDVSTKRVYRLVGSNDREVTLTRIMNGYHTGLPWLAPDYNGTTSKLEDDESLGFLGQYIDYA